MRSIFLKVCGVHQFSMVDGCRGTLAEMAGCYLGMALLHATLPGMKHQPPESWAETLPCSSWVPATDDPSVQIKLIWGTTGKGNPEFLPQFWEPYMMSGRGAYLVSVGEYGPILPSPMTHLAFSCTHAPLTPSIHCLHEFLWPLLKEERGNLRVGLELIRMGDSNCQSTDFPKKLFLFPYGKLSFLECSEICHGISRQVSCGDDVS